MSLANLAQISAYASLYSGAAEEAYPLWPAPQCVISDGPYGVGGYPGDPHSPQGLGEWYRPHARAWAQAAGADCSLWVWGTERSWAEIHPVLEEEGWDYLEFCVWDKGMAHAAGNVNSQTIRRFPVVTEACVLYHRRAQLPDQQGHLLDLQAWVRHEWQRSGLPLREANQAAGVANAATRKYLTADRVWYFPPPQTMERLAVYANQHGKPTSRPYFSIDGAPLSAQRWERMRPVWNHQHGINNVWREPALRGAERFKDASGKVIHTNQKPLRLMRQIVSSCTQPGDTVWEPFGGLCTGSLAAAQLGRFAYAAESVAQVAQRAAQRLAAGGSSAEGSPQ